MKRPRILILVAGACLAIAACAHTPPPEPQIRTVEVKVPVPVPCKADVDVRDEKSYVDAAAETLTDIFDQVRALLTGREERKEDAAKLRGAVTGCGGTVR